MKTRIISLILLLFLVSCLKEEDIKPGNSDYTPLTVDDDWEISSPENENMNREILDQAYELFFSEDEFVMANSLIVVRNGRIIAEAYCKDPDDINRPHNVQSITKSFTSLLTGIALQKGILTDINTPLYDFYPEAFDDDQEKRKITIRNCLIMKTGIDFNNSDNTEELYHAEGSSLSYILSLPMSYDTGLVFHYNDGAPHLAGGAIARASGMSLEKFADDYLFKPLGIVDYKWEKAADGLNFGAFSLFLKPRDMAKAGQLCLQDGEWNGIQLVDPSWIREATSVQSGTGSAYGYYFWIIPSLEGYYMLGHGGQFIYVCPTKNLVAVYTASPYISDIFFGEFETLIELIYQAAE